MGGYDGVIWVIVMSEEKELVVDEEFKKLIPPLSDEEYRILEECIVEEGCRDPLVLWGNVILDGHNRYDICMRRGLIFKTVEKNFDDRDDAMVWIIKNQFGRRNLTDGWKLELKARYKDLLREIGKKKLSDSGKKGGRGNKKPLSDNDKPFVSRTELAKDLGWSTGKMCCLFSHQWSSKRIRMTLGLLMFFGFMFLVQVIYFFCELGTRFDSLRLVVLSVFLFHYLWVPCVCLIVLCYVLLTKIWKYQP